MHKKLLIILSIFTLLLTNVKSDEIVIKQLKKGGNIVFIRHAIAPGGGDPENFRLDDCSTQRNLDSQGIEQSKKMGLFFQQNNIPIDKVLSSEWCRCKDTAKIAFGKFKTLSALNSFYEARYAKNKFKQIKDLKKYINNWESDSNLIIVTHYIVISALLNTTTSSGEMVITDKKLNILGNLEIN